jgi:hypothetical protein
MTKPAHLSRVEHLREIPDPRMMRAQRHELLDILIISLCPAIGGADHWTEEVEFGQAKQSWFAGFLKLANDIPSHDTFARVFRLINTEVLERVCHEWLRSVAGRVQGVVAIDGKSVRGARDGKKHPLHIISLMLSTQMVRSGPRVQADAVAVQVGDVGEKAHARRQGLAWQGNLATCRRDPRQRSVQRRRRIQIHQRATVARLGGTGVTQQRAAYATAGGVIGKHRQVGRPHGLAAQRATQHGFVKNLGTVQVGGGDFKPADGVFHED